MGIMTAVTSREELQERTPDSYVSLLVRSALIVGVLAGVVFFVFPSLDMKTSAFFYQGNGVFSGKGGGIFSMPPITISDYVRLFLYVSFIAVCILNAIVLAASLFFKRDIFGLGAPKWLFLAACLILGPGVVSNVILKDNWGRARPAQIVEFGGTKTYSPPLVLSNQCQRNCSFVTGEASMLFATFFASAFLFPLIGRRLIAAGALIGLFSGIIRISQGAHFLSDVVFAGVAMALTVAGVYVLFKALHGLTGSAAEDPLS